LVYVKKRVKQR